MCPADLAQADGLRQIAGWNQRLSDWQRFLDLSPRGCFVAETAGRILGTVTTIEYEAQVGWIGMLLVHPQFRGRGFGKALLIRAIEHLQAKKIPCIKLDATPLGEALYRKLGFRDEWNLTRFKGVAKHILTGSPRKAVGLKGRNLANGIALDAEAFGSARKKLMASLVASAHIAIGHPGERALNAFGLLRPGSEADYLGPIVAKTSRVAGEIIAALLDHAARTADRPFYWDIPHPNKAALALARKLDLSPERELLRMCLGPNDYPGDVSKYFAIADPSLG
jgi:GNAT superfamily N-acetyltransferase